MKSAFERAMERFGGETVRELTAAQKQQLAEIQSIYAARIAQVKLKADEDLRALAGEPEKADALRARMAAEIAGLEEQREAKKNALRKEFGA